LHWWGTYSGAGGECLDGEETEDTFEIKFYEDDGGQPGDEVQSYRVTADRDYAGFFDLGASIIYEFSADLPSCFPLASGWVSIQGYGGNANCWLCWVMSVDGDLGFAHWDGSALLAYEWDLSLCLTTRPDGDGDLIPDDVDACPGTAAGDPVDANGCSTADDDGDGVLNDQDDCPGTAAGDPVDADGCSTADDDSDGVLNDDDLCADTPTCATNVDTDGCAIDTDGDGNVDGCEPPPQTCCGGAGPVGPLGLAIGLLLLGRCVRRRS
jgi:hypothetical protein